MPNLDIEPRILHEFCLMQHMPFQAVIVTSVSRTFAEVSISLKCVRRRWVRAWLNECIAGGELIPELGRIVGSGPEAKSDSVVVARVHFGWHVQWLQWPFEKNIFGFLYRVRLLKALGCSIIEGMRLMSTAVDFLALTTIQRTVAWDLNHNLELSSPQLRNYQHTMTWTEKNFVQRVTGTQNSEWARKRIL